MIHYTSRYKKRIPVIGTSSSESQNSDLNEVSVKHKVHAVIKYAVCRPLFPTKWPGYKARVAI